MFRPLFLLLFLLASPLAAFAFTPGFEVPDLRRLDEVIQPARLDRDLLTFAVFAETNLCRLNKGRAPLELLAPLTAAASAHAEAMTEHGFFDHQNRFDREQRTLSDRISRVGLDPAMISENIAMTFSMDFHAVSDWMRNGGRGAQPQMRQHTYRTFARSLVQQWMDSRGHRANILNRSLKCIGLGFATVRDSKGLDRFYCVQDFYTPATALAQPTLAFNRRRVSAL